MSLSERLAEIEEARKGPRTAAFFDFDGTLIDGYSAYALMQERARKLEIGPAEVARLLTVAAKGAAGQSSFDELMRVGVRSMAGRSEEQLDELGRRLARGVLGGWLHGEALELVAAHRRRGHRIVIASSALPFQIEPLARELRIEDVLCTRPKIVDGTLDGTIDGAILWGKPKADAVKAYAKEHGVSLRSSFAYANGGEDVDFLSQVGHPCAVNPHEDLEGAARENGWVIEDFEARGRPGVTDAVRTVAAYSGMAAAFGVGLGLGLLNRDRRTAVNLSTSIGSDVALSLAGVNLDVAGMRNLWSDRPAVFIFNHQSWLDGLIIMRLLREDMTGVAKKEVASQPGFGQFARLAGMAFVDRARGTNPKKALEPVVEKLHEGKSIAIAPEGTRSTTPWMGPFKKGAFHIAMQAGVPIVPIVIRNAGELLWRGSKVIRSGTVDVIVHPAIAVDDWSADNVDAHVAEVRDLMVDTLAHWETHEIAVDAAALDPPASERARAGAPT